MFSYKQLKSNNTIIILASAASLLIAGLWLYFGMSGKSNPLQAFRGVAVEVEEVRQGSITRRITAVGTLSANQSVIIRPQVRGIIKSINFKEGSQVNKNDVLVELDDRAFKAALKEAQAHLINAKAQFERAGKLAERKAVAPKKVDELRAALEAAEARFEKASLDVENTVIRAPFEGIVGLKDFSVGAAVDERSDLVTLVDVDPIKVDFRIPGQFVHYISKGEALTATVDGFGAESFKGYIDAIDARVDPLAHSIAIKATISNPTGILKPGLFARISLVVGAKEKTLIIPEVALLSSGDEKFVYRVVEGASLGIKQNVAIKTIVTTGLIEEGNVEIVRGLAAGEKVVTVGQSKIRDGTPVRIVLDADNPDLNTSLSDTSIEETKTPLSGQKAKHGANPPLASEPTSDNQKEGK